MGLQRASIIYCVGILASAQALAQADLDALLKLNDKLPFAVCDEAGAQRLPSLKLQEPERGHRAARETLWLKPSGVSESRALELLLGDPEGWLPSPAAQKLALDKKPVQEIKRQVSREFCTATVTPGRLKKLLTAEPAWVLRAERAPRGNGVWLEIVDSESRFGPPSGGSWLVPGWVEPLEVVGLKLGARKFVRARNPVTERTLGVVMLGASEEPLGVFSLSQEATSWDPESEGARLKLIEAYRWLLEGEAYRRAGDGDRGKFGAVLEAFREQAMGEKSAARAFRGSELKGRVDDEFEGWVAAARVGGTQVRFHPLPNDGRLHSLFTKTRTRFHALPLQ